MKKQILPISISLGLFLVCSVLTHGLLSLLKLPVVFLFVQFLLGIFIYLKTSVDYALFVGSLMENNTGIQKRIAMNVGTQVGCFLGVSLIAILWTFFKEIHWLMAILLFVAGNVLIGLGDGSQEHFDAIPEGLKRPLAWFFNVTRPIVSKVTFFMPDSEMRTHGIGWKRLFFTSMIIPFALGADDLAGYMVLLTTINAFSLLVGIYFGDAIIDIALFWNPTLTVAIVKNRWVSYFGALFFIFLGVVSVIHAVNLLH